jgi:glycosyltransferase involved in cell wall biosynthesis
VLVGDGPNRKEYEILVEKYGLEDKVIFTGWRKDVTDFYKAADIFFFPSRGEGMPGAVMEAMAAGLPIVATDIPAISCLAIDKKSGFLCENTDINRFVEVIEVLIGNGELRSRMGTNALEAIRKFDWKYVIEMYSDLYRSL